MIGRFINQDPIGLAGGMNLYRLEGTVQNGTDPLGLYNAQKCAALADKIKNLEKEIYEKRIPALQSNPNNLPWRIGPNEALRDTVRGHVKLLNSAYSKLDKAYKAWDDNDCNNPPPSPTVSNKCANSSTSQNDDSTMAYITIAGTVVIVGVCIYATAGVCGIVLSSGGLIGATAM